MGRSARILVIYWNPYGRRMRLSTANHLEAVCRVGGQGDVIAINAHGGVPRLARTVAPTAVILHTTFLGIRWLSSFERWRERTAWISGLDCPILALPQDEFDHAAVLDEWLDELGVSDLFTTLPRHVDVLYPRTSARASVTGVLTGYIDGELASVMSPAFGDRPKDVVYRAARLPYWFGRLGQLKAEIADRADEAARRLRLDRDISVRTHDAVTGRRWLTFLSSGRITVGAESGSSIIDPDGSVRRAVQLAMAQDPTLSYDEVAARVGGGAWDRRWFAAVSPRHLEAAATRTVQVLVEGSYSGVLEADRHYVPVKRDFSDLDSALCVALDPDLAAAMTERAHAEIVESGSFAADRLTSLLRACLGSEEGPPAPFGALAAVRLAAKSWDAFLDGRAAIGRLRRFRSA